MSACYRSPVYCTVARFAVGMAVLLAGCSDSTSPRTSSASLLAEVDFQTDASAYVLHAGSIAYEGAIEVTYTNHSGSNVYFVNCRGGTGVTLEKKVGEQWVPAYSPVRLMCLG